MSDETRDARARLVEAADAQDGRLTEEAAETLLDLWCSHEHRDDLARVLGEEYEFLRECADTPMMRDVMAERDEAVEELRSLYDDLIFRGVSAAADRMRAASAFLARLDKENQG